MFTVFLGLPVQDTRAIYNGQFSMSQQKTSGQHPEVFTLILMI